MANFISRCAAIGLLALLSACTPPTSLGAADFERFTSWIAGEWDNIAQVEAEGAAGVPQGARRARYAMRYTPIDAPAIDGRLFAIENYDDGAGFDGAIGRVSLHRFWVRDEDGSILHEILFLKDAAFRKSLIGNLKPLQDITEADIRARADCRLYWRWTGARFEGATLPGSCITNSYSDADILVEGSGTLSNGQMQRHDRNFKLPARTEIPRPGYESADVFLKIGG